MATPKNMPPQAQPTRQPSSLPLSWSSRRGRSRVRTGRRATWVSAGAPNRSHYAAPSPSQERLVGRQLGSAATVSGGRQNIVCAYRSIKLGIGRAACAARGWPCPWRFSLSMSRRGVGGVGGCSVGRWSRCRSRGRGLGRPSRARIVRIAPAARTPVPTGQRLHASRPW